MAYLFSENSQKILRHLQANVGTDETVAMIAEKVGMTEKAANAVILSGLQRRDCAYRVEVDGFDRKVIRLTEKVRQSTRRLRKHNGNSIRHSLSNTSYCLLRCFS